MTGGERAVEAHSSLSLFTCHVAERQREAARGSASTQKGSQGGRRTLVQAPLSLLFSHLPMLPSKHTERQQRREGRR